MHTCATHSIIDIVLLIKISANIIFMHSLGRGALVTSSFDVVKTRLQSEMLRQRHAGVGAVVGDSVLLLRRLGGLLWHFVETAYHPAASYSLSFLRNPHIHMTRDRLKTLGIQ